MALQNFVDKVGPVVSAAWLNAVDILKFTIFADSTTKAAARTALTLDAPLEVTNGGTGARTAADAIINLQIGGGQTDAEGSAGVVPTNYEYPPGDVRRYGAVGDGLTDDSVALNAALSCGGRITVKSGMVCKGTNLVMDEDFTELVLEPGSAISNPTATNKLITVSGDMCRISGPGRLIGQATFDGSNGARTYAVIWITGEDCTVEGVYMDTIPRCGIRVEEVARVYIRGCIIDGKFPWASYSEPGATTGHMGIDINPPSTSGGPHCAYVIDANRVSECIQGVFLGNTGAAGSEQGLAISGNTFQRCWDHAIYGTLLEGSAITGNVMVDCKRPIVADGMAPVITGNVLYSTSTQDYGQQHINLRECSGAVITGNTLYGLDASIRLDCISTDSTTDTMENCVVANNMLYRTGYGTIGSSIRLGFDADTCRNNLIEGNVIYGVEYGAGVGVIQLEMYSGQTGTGNTIRGNHIRYSSTDSGGEGGAGIYVSNHDHAVIEDNVIECFTSAAAAATARMVYIPTGLNCSIQRNVFKYLTGGTNVTVRAIQTDTGTVTGKVKDNRFYLTSGSLTAAYKLDYANDVTLTAEPGQAAANTATPSGATAYQLPVYDGAGTLLGYVPVYTSPWS